MNILFVSILNPYSSSHKGDFKLLNQRASLLQNSGYNITLVYFRLSLCLVPYTQNLPPLGNQLNLLSINIPILPFILRILFTIPRHLLSRKPIQTLLSRVYSQLSQSLLDQLYSDYESVHFFHVRSCYFFCNSNSVPNPNYELIDSYALNLSRRLLLSSSPLSRLLYKYEAKAIESEEYRIIKHKLSPRVFFVSHLDARHYTVSSQRLPAAVPLYTQIYSYNPPSYSAGSTINVGFFGNLNYHPNIYAVKSLIDLSNYNLSLDDPLPLRFHVGGRFLPSNLRRLLVKTSFDVTSPIPSIPVFLEQIDICIFFMQAGSGMQSKLLEAASNSCPIITTQQPYEAIFGNPDQLPSEQAALVAPNLLSVHNLLHDIYTGSLSICDLARNAHLYIQQYYSPDAVASHYLSTISPRLTR